MPRAVDVDVHPVGKPHEGGEMAHLTTIIITTTIGGGGGGGDLEEEGEEEEEKGLKWLDHCPHLFI